MRPTNQTLALSVAAIIVMLGLRVVYGIGHSLFARQGDPTIWDSPPAAMSALLWLTLALVLGWFYCIRASVGLARSWPCSLHTGIALSVAWLFAVLCALLLVFAFTQWAWLEWVAYLW